MRPASCGSVSEERRRARIAHDVPPAKRPTESKGLAKKVAHKLGAKHGGAQHEALSADVRSTEA